MTALDAGFGLQWRRGSDDAWRPLLDTLQSGTHEAYATVLNSTDAMRRLRRGEVVAMVFRRHLYDVRMVMLS